MRNLWMKPCQHYLKKALLEKIENDFDLRVGQEALKEYKQDPVTYSVAEMRAKYGL